MASPAEMSSSSTSRSATSLMPGRLVIAYDATKDRNVHEIKGIVTNICTRDRMIEEVDTITVLGVLHKVLHPMGFQMKIGSDSFMGTHIRAIKEDVSRKVGAQVGMLQHNAVECGEHGVAIEVRVVVGAPLRKVVVQEVTASNATWVILDRHLRKDLKFFLKHISCRVALVLDNLSLDILRPYFSDKNTGIIDHKLLYSLSKNVPISPAEYSVISSNRASTCSRASSDSDKSSLVSSLTFKSKEQSISSPDEFGSSPYLDKLGFKVETKFKLVSSTCDCPELQVAPGDVSSDTTGVVDSKVESEYDEFVLRPSGTIVDSMRYSYSEIQKITNDFSFDNLLGEGGYGVVYKGQLKDGQLVAVKVQSRANTKQAFAEFHSEVSALRFALHRNIVMLIGYCCMENISILVYEFICNKSLEMHLFDNTSHVLEWHHRHAIAIGIAKALRFLHEECRGGPIIHRDIRPSNILLTHDFVPLLGDCGLAKMRTNKRNKQSSVVGTLAYCAPECLTASICSEKTDVFAFGIVLIQLITGRKNLDSTSRKESLRQWALPLIQKLALEELVDSRLGDSYSTYELYQVARAAYLCAQTKPEMRPTIGEVLLLLEGKNDHLHHLMEQFIPHHSSVSMPALVEISMEYIEYSSHVSLVHNLDGKIEREFKGDSDQQKNNNICVSSEMGSTSDSYVVNRFMGSCVLVVFDATKDRSKEEFVRTLHNIRMLGGIVHSGDTITVLGVLHKVLHPLGYQMGVAPENFLGATHARAVEEEVSKKVDLYVDMLHHSAEECQGEGVDIEVKITAGTPIRKVVIQEVVTCKPAWVIVDRHLRRESAFFLKHIPSKVALVLADLTLNILRPQLVDMETDYAEDINQFYSLCKTIPLIVRDNENSEQSSVNCQESFDISMHNSLPSFTSSSKDHIFSLPNDFGPKLGESEAIIPKVQNRTIRQRFPELPLLCISCGLETEMDSKKYSYSEISLATNDFSAGNLVGEGGYGRVYKGTLNDGQQIAAKVRKEASSQGCCEFHAEVYVLNFARHKNIVMLLGYCCKENLNILVYEYICNKSLEWHLFENSNHVLEWHRRHAIAVGTAKGLRFLHEEFRGTPVIHRDVRPGNILLNHDFVPMLGDFGLAKWKRDNEDIQTSILGTIGYLAPEYVESGIISVRTDVYAFGIVLIQLISGRKAVNPTRANNQPSLRQWALPLLETLAFHELVDSRLGDYNPIEMYHMARTAYLCVQIDPQRRPSMSEVLRILEGESERFQHLAEQFIPHYSK